MPHLKAIGGQSQLLNGCIRQDLGDWNQDRMKNILEELHSVECEKKSMEIHILNKKLLKDLVSLSKGH